MLVRCFDLRAAIVLSLTVCGSAIAAESRIGIDRDDEKGRLRVNIDGREAFVFRYGTDVDLPHFDPLRAPTGTSLLVARTEPYPHHRAFWFADTVQLTGKRKVSFYSALYSGQGSRENSQPPYRDHIRLVDCQIGERLDGELTLHQRLVWEMDNTQPVLNEIRKLRIVALSDGEYLLDITFTVTAAHGDVSFVSDAVHYAWPYVRMSPKFSVDRGGTMTNSEGGINQSGTHNNVAKWVDYSNTVDGATCGLTVFSHSDNSHPHRWLTRDYGTFGPRRDDAHSGKPFTLTTNSSLQQRVGILVHRGDVNGGKVAQRYAAYRDGQL